MAADLNIAVLGAGVVGLTTALELQKEFRLASINIISENFYQDTTSFVAAGLFRPGTNFSGPSEEITRKWINDSYHYWEDLGNTSDAYDAGVMEISGYLLSSTHPELVRNSYLEKLLPLYRSATEQELNLCPGNWKYGAFFTTVLTQCSKYLPWATRRFKGRITDQKINSFADIDNNYDVIVNCTGLGSKFLCNDRKLVPMRGQVVKVRAPWIKTFFYGDYDTYIIPGVDNTVTLGGCRQYDSYNLAVNKYDKMSIIERCESLVPSLKNAEFVADRVGLRPHRDPVRVEKEIYRTVASGKPLKIVHNYGHGGYGVTTAPGTSLHAVKLVREILAGNSKL